MNDSSPVAEIQSVRVDESSRGRVLTRWEGRHIGLPELSIGARAEDWVSAIHQLLSDDFDSPSRTMLKTSGGKQVFRTPAVVGNQTVDVVVKRRREGGALGGWPRRILGCRESRMFDAAVRLLRCGILTPPPLAVIERTGPECESFLITLAVPGGQDLETILSSRIWELEPTDAWRAKGRIIRALSSMCLAMQQNGVEHRDFKASNMMVTNWMDARACPRLWLIDLEGVRFGRRARNTSVLPRSIIRLAASLVHCRGVTRSDALRWIRLWLEMGGSSEWSAKALWKDGQRRVDTYLQKSRRRKRGKIDGYSNP